MCQQILSPVKTLDRWQLGRIWILAGAGAKLWQLAIDVVVFGREGRHMCDVGRQIENDCLKSR